jgi:hypothetical protein
MIGAWEVGKDGQATSVSKIKHWRRPSMALANDPPILQAAPLTKPVEFRQLKKHLPSQPSARWCHMLHPTPPFESINLHAPLEIPWLGGVIMRLFCDQQELIIQQRMIKSPQRIPIASRASRILKMGRALHTPHRTVVRSQNAAVELRYIRGSQSPIKSDIGSVNAYPPEALGPLHGSIVPAAKNFLFVLSYS